MYNIVALFSMAMLVAAKPSVVTPLVYTSVIPGLSSVSQYSSRVVHGSPAANSDAVNYNPDAIYNVPPYNIISDVSKNAQQSTSRREDTNDSDVLEERAGHISHYGKGLSSNHQLRKPSDNSPLSSTTFVSPDSYTSPLIPNYLESLMNQHSSRPIVSAHASAAASPLAFSSVYSSALGAHPY